MTTLTTLPLAYTIFEDVQGTQLQRMTGTWEDIVRSIESPREYSSKGSCPLLKLATFGEVRSAKGGLRTDKNLLSISGIEGDYDGEAVSPAEAAARLTAVSADACIYTTASHTPEKPRWRVVAPLSHPHEPHEHEGLVALLNGALGGILADESFTLSQSYFIGKITGVKYETHRTRGLPLDHLDLFVDPIGKKRVVVIGDLDSHAVEVRVSDEELIRQISSGESYHAPLLALSARYHGRGMGEKTIVATLQGIMRAHCDESPRWQDRFDDIPRMVTGAIDKFPVQPVGGIRHGRGDIKALTEIGTADRLRAALSGRARFVPEIGLWMVWEDRWIGEEGRARMTEAAKQIKQMLYREAEDLLRAGQGEDSQKVLDWALRVQTLKMLNSTIDLLSLIPEMRLGLASLDADPLVVGLDGARQVLDLETGKVRPAVPDDYVMKSLGVSELGDVTKAVTWLRFLNDVFDGDQELIEWIQRWSGYLLTGNTSEQCLLFLYGTGKNGKSVFVSTLRSTLGDYAKAIPSESLAYFKRDPQSASPDLARLAGARLVTSVETEDGQQLAESLIKSLTGGDPVVARYLHKDPFEFDPSFKLMIAGNHKPVIRGTDSGIWRRIHLVPFTRMFGDGEADPLMANKLRAEAPHILAWMVQGYRAWQREGLGKPPHRVEEATLEYRDAMDTMGEFLADRCEQASDAFVAADALFQNFQSWSQVCGLRPPVRQPFRRKIGERPGITAGKCKGVRGYWGVRLVSSPPGDVVI